MASLSDKINKNKKIISLSIILSIITSVVFIPIPYWDGSTIWDKTAIGQKVEIESIFPPGSDGIEFNYQNTGGVTLNDIEIRATIIFDIEESTSNNRTKEIVAKLEKRRLTKGENAKGVLQLSNAACELIVSDPISYLYLDNTGKCYTEIKGYYPKNSCIAHTLTITFYSAEFPEGIVHSEDYPIASEIKIQSLNCTDVNQIRNKTYLTLIGQKKFSGIFENWTHTLNKTRKLAKKYCLEGLMSADWCRKNQYS